LHILLHLSALVNLTKSLDPTRAVTFVTSQAADKDQAVSSQWGQEVKNIYAETTLQICMCFYKRGFGKRREVSVL